MIYNKSIQHVLPINDLVEHEDTGFMCACLPKIMEYKYGFVVIHNSYDGREWFERKIICPAGISERQ